MKNAECGMRKPGGLPVSGSKPRSSRHRIASRSWRSILWAGVFGSLTLAAAAPLEQQQGYLEGRFIFTNAPFRSAHASTLVETKNGLLAAWFGGTDEGNPDVGIWSSRLGNSGWSAPILVADGRQADGKTRYPCWNPVLTVAPGKPVLLLYKVGPSPSRWWGMMLRSEDEGRSWNAPKRLPKEILGPIRNKPVLLADGSMLCGSSTEDDGWRVHLERTDDWGESWDRTSPLHEKSECGLIQPTILRWPSGRVQILCRSRQGQVYESWMGDSWKRWSKPAPIELPNPNSGIDGLVLQDGRGLLVYNHTPKGRTPINVAVSRDGRSWEAALVLENEPGEYSYPAAIQAEDGRVHITYTWKRQRIKHVVVDPAKLQPRPMTGHAWPATP